MTHAQKWFALGVVAGVLLLHALLPRYAYQHQTGAAWLRVDRWTGRAQAGRADSASGGHWRAPDAPVPVAANDVPIVVTVDESPLPDAATLEADLKQYGGRFVQPPVR